MNTLTTEADIELATIRQSNEIERELHRLRLARAEQELEELQRVNQDALNEAFPAALNEASPSGLNETLPAAPAAGAGAAPTVPASERDAAGDLYRQVHVFPKGRWS